MADAIGTLGCAVSYDVLVVSKDGIPLGHLTPSGDGTGVSQVIWNRSLDDISTATITVTVSPECCDILANIHVWHHELQIFRNGEYVWSGPVTQILINRTSVTITAQDLFSLMNQRIVHNALCFATDCGNAPTDLTTIGTDLIMDAFLVDGHNYSIQSVLTGLLGQRLFQPGENSFSALQEVLALGLDATVLGSKIVLGMANGGAPFGRTSALTCDDFLTDLSFEEDGLGLATRAIVLGNPNVGVATSPGSDVNGQDPYYGLIEYVSPSRSEIVNQAEADTAAQAIISARWPAPGTLVTPSGAQLSPNAPTPIATLVPGAVTTIIADCLCREVTADYVLTHLEVQWSVGGEVVQVTYGTIGSVNAGLNQGV